MVIGIKNFSKLKEELCKPTGFLVHERTHRLVCIEALEPRTKGNNSLKTTLKKDMLLILDTIGTKGTITA